MISRLCIDVKARYFRFIDKSHISVFENKALDKKQTKVTLYRLPARECTM